MNLATVRRLLALADAPRARVALAVMLGALTVVLGIGLMATAGYLISRAAEQPPILSLTVAIALVRFFALARPLSRYFERLASHDLAFWVLGRIRVRTYERIEPLAPAQLEGFRRGDLLSRMVSDIDALQNLHLRGIGPPLVAVVAGVTAVAVTATLLPVAGLALAAGLVAGGALVPTTASLIARRTGSAHAAARGAMSAELVDLLHAAPEIVVYGQEDSTLARLSRADERLTQIGLRDALAGGLADGLVLVVMGLTVTGVLALAVSAHGMGSLDRTLIAALALLALASFEAVQPLAASARDLSVTVAAGRRVLDLVDRKPAVTDPRVPTPPPTAFDVEFHDVRARYAPGERAPIDGASFRLDGGARVALIGESGAGKSTIANLLLRFLDPERGRITLGGRVLSDYRQEDVRRAIAVCGQDAHAFSTTILENVRLARPDASDADIEHALRTARLWDWVTTLPDGWNTLVGEDGRELSGGQRQRLAVARALLADARVLVLDEPTAHLDGETARALVEDVFVAAQHRSVLLMTHRPEGLDLVDQVFVLEHGRITPAPAV